MEASGSTRLRMGESLPNHHEDHIAGKAGKGENSLQGMGKIGKDSGVEPDESQK